MFILKACPKCRGDLLTSARLRDLDAKSEVSCLQCGYVLQPAQSAKLFTLLPRREPALQPAYVPVRR
jgi:hypothetical protein